MGIGNEPSGCFKHHILKHTMSINFIFDLYVNGDMDKIPFLGSEGIVGEILMHQPIEAHSKLIGFVYTIYGFLPLWRGEKEHWKRSGGFGNGGLTRNRFLCGVMHGKSL